MRNTTALSLLGSLVIAAFAMGPAGAQSPPRCPEGRMADGSCVNPVQAQDLRTGTIVLSQPKLSMTNPPVMPFQDALYDIPRDHHEIRNLHGYPPVTSVYGRTTVVRITTNVTPFFADVTVNLGPAP